MRFLLAALVAAYCSAFSPQATQYGNKKSVLFAENGPSRRDFLSQSVAASGLLPSLPAQAASKAAAIDLPPMGLGAWAWGDALFWKYDKKNDDELRHVFDYAVAQSKPSKTLFDTAELYGFGRSETLLGDFSKDVSDKVLIASKFAAYPFRTKANDVVKACEASVKRCGGRPLDIYQIHFPNAYSNAEYWDGLAECYEKGLIKACGVSNYGVDAMRACHDSLAKRGIPLATNQIQFSLLYKWPLENGLLDACKDLGVQVLAYSPLALGMLTGKYSRDNPPAGPRSKIFEQLLSTPDYQNLLDTMKQVASNHGSDATLSQVAINWTRAKGTVPIPGARTISQVQQNYGALDWSLSKQEEQMLDEASAKVTTFLTPDKNPFPKKDKDTGLIMYDS